MPEKIFTIPIQEAFDFYDGCPFCRLREKLERQTLDYTLGAAMMEPDVRIEMNRTGFCREHLRDMYGMKNKLALGLILESHLDEVRRTMEAPPAGSKRGLLKKSSEEDGTEGLWNFTKSCFVCNRIRGTELRYSSNAAWLWETDSAFREKLRKQPCLCMTHSAMLLKIGKSELKAEHYTSLYEAVMALQDAYAAALREHVTEFTVSFDHRNAGKPLTEEARGSLERALQFLK